MTEFIYLLISYLLGTFMTAWFVGKWYGVALQTMNGGNLGARNAGRTLGKWAFIITAISDGLKGVAVVVGGRLLDFPKQTIALAVLAVVLGHLYPFWLKGRGGKGVATVIGAMLAFSPISIVAFLAALAFAFLLLKSMTLSMIVGFIAYGVAIIWLNLAGAPIVLVALALVIWKHRENIMERVR